MNNKNLIYTTNNHYVMLINEPARPLYGVKEEYLGIAIIDKCYMAKTCEWEEILEGQFASLFSIMLDNGVEFMVREGLLVDVLRILEKSGVECTNAYIC